MMVYFYLSSDKKPKRFEFKLRYYRRMCPTVPHIGHWSTVVHLPFALTLVLLALIGDGLCCESDNFESDQGLQDSKHEAFFKNFHINGEHSMKRSTKDIQIGQENSIRRHPLRSLSKVFHLSILITTYKTFHILVGNLKLRVSLYLS